MPRIPGTNVMKRCTKCGEEKPESEFHKNRRSKDGLCSRCKACCCERSREWYIANRERERDKYRKWRKDYPEAVRMAEDRSKTRKFLEQVPNGECYLYKARRLLRGEVVDPHCAGSGD